MSTQDIILTLVELTTGVLICLGIFLAGLATGKSARASTEQEELVNTLDQASNTIAGLRTSLKEYRIQLIVDRCESISPLPCQECLRLNGLQDCPQPTEHKFWRR